MKFVFRRLSVMSRRGRVACLTIPLLGCAVFASKKETEAASLIDRAKQVSDIRAEGAPAFRLKIHFKVTNEDGSSQVGTYSEIWASRTQWRRETTLGDFRRTEVASGRKLWRLDSATTAPEHIGDMLGFFEISKPQVQLPQYLKPLEIEDQQLGRISARCIETIPDPHGERSALCFDRSNGTLAAAHQPLRVGMRSAARNCDFSDYQKFGDRMVAGSYQCYEDGHLRFQAKIAEITAETTPDPALFAALDGAKESANCLGEIKQGMLIDKENPRQPIAVSVRPPEVIIRATIGTDGKLHDLKVVSSSNSEFDNSALDALRHWRYKPYTCDGEPVEVDTEVTVNFGFFRP